MKLKTENQNRAWLETKLANYFWKIKGKNAYGSRKRQRTIVKELREIIDEFEKNILDK